MKRIPAGDPVSSGKATSLENTVSIPDDDARDPAANAGRPVAPRTAAIASLPDEALIARIESLSLVERVDTLEILLHLIEVERRQLWRGLEYRSMFDYCVRRLRYSEGAAGRRLRTARLIAKYPYVHDRIRKGRLSLCAVSKIARAVLEHGRRDLIEIVEGKRLDQIDAILAVHRNPSRPVRESIRLLCVERRVAGEKPEAADAKPHPGAQPDRTIAGDGAVTATATGDEAGTGDSAAGASPGDSGGAPAGRSEDPVHRPNEGTTRTAIERVYRFQFGIEARTMTKFARVQSIAAIRAGGHVDLSALFEVLCDTYLDRYDAATRAKKKAKRTPGPGNGRLGRAARPVVSRAVRDEVVRRDGGRCTFVDGNGERCTETIGLQVDHVKPAALGGSNQPGNLRAMCPAHNRLLAERTFGKTTVARAIDRARSRDPG